MKPVGLDHIVLTVASVEKTILFYTEVLGLEEVTFGDNRKALKIGEQKINVHQFGAEFFPHANTPQPGSADICLIYEDGIKHIIDSLSKHNINIEIGPVNKTGARGAIKSVYIRDPDQNLLELSVYE